MPRVHHVIHSMLLCVAIAALAPLGAQAQSYVFGAASYSVAGPGPMMEADFNGDGIPDLAVLGSSNGMSQAMSIFLGTTHGAFAPRVDYLLGLNGGPIGASDFTVGDFRGNGTLDIVLISESDYYAASIMLGNGNGTFQAPVPLNQTIPNGSFVTVASADFNGDGKLDLVFISNNFGTGATMLVLFGNGDGTFQLPASYSTDGGYLAIGDFNGDGLPDIALASGVYDSYPASSQISVYMNNGAGAYQTPVNYPIGGNVTALALADLNGDGKLDLVASTGGTAATVYTLLGNGNGTFGSALSYTYSLLSIYGAPSIATGDFNGDGKLDLALTNHVTPDNGIDVMLGNGDGTFQNPPLVYGGGLGPEGILAWDFSGSGRPGLAVLGSSYSSYSVTILANQGNGSLPHPATYPVVKYPWHAVGGDFTGDGKADVAVASITTNSGGQDNGGVISVFPGKGDGTFQPRVDTDITTFPEIIAPGDFNGDGTLDLVVVEETLTSTQLVTWLGNGDGTFQNNISQTLPSAVGYLTVGDFNGDGIPDVAATVDSVSGVGVFMGTGGGTFASPVFYPVGPSGAYGSSLASADFNGDGLADLAVTTSQGISILIANANGTFQPYSAILPGEILLTVGDFNGDGIPDLVFTSGTPFVTVALGNGKGDFTPAASYQVPEAASSFSSPIVGDFNGDGKLDLAFSDQSGDVTTILFGNGDGTFGRTLEIATAQVPSLVAADFNGDGALDLAMTDVTNQQLDVWLNQSVAALEPLSLSFAPEPAGARSGGQTVTLANPGSAPMEISGITLSGYYSQTNNCPKVLAVGAGCVVSVSFTPPGAGTFAGAIGIYDNAAGSPQTIALSGTGVVFTTGPQPPVALPPPAIPQPGLPGSPPVSPGATGPRVRPGREPLPAHPALTPMGPATAPISPGVRFSASTLTFSAQAVGTGSGIRTITLTNSGIAPLAIVSITVSGDFAQTNDCAGSVTPDNPCTINVTFKPAEIGARTGTLTITGNINGVADCKQVIPLSGTGSAAPASRPSRANPPLGAPVSPQRDQF